MQIPQSDILTTNRLGNIFSNTVATYKFFWFVSIMQIHAKTGNLKISVWDIVIRMVANAWYPIHYFRLSFGKSDSLFDIVMELQRITQIPIDANAETIISVIKEWYDDRQVKKLLNTLTLNVPYRFLSPWISTPDNKLMVERSHTLENGCLYSLYKNGCEFYIELNPAWDNYLHTHYSILVDFAYWNLTLFLQARNPNVPAIPNKLIRPEVRNSLTKQHHYWDEVMKASGPICCIYTGKELHPKDYDLDHGHNGVRHLCVTDLQGFESYPTSKRAYRKYRHVGYPRPVGWRCIGCWCLETYRHGEVILSRSQDP